MPVNSNASAKSANNKRVFLPWSIIGLILIFCLWLAFIYTGEVLCGLALDQIAELTNTEITTKSVDFSINGSILIEDLVIRPELQKEYDDTILKAEKVYARFGIVSLLFLQPQLKKISVKDFVFDAQHNLDTDQWNISVFRIKPPKSPAKKMPVIRLKRGMLRYSEVSNGQVKIVAAVPIDADFAPAHKIQRGYSFDITTAKRAGHGKSILAGFWEPGRITINGEISSADVPIFEKAWAINALEAELRYDGSSDYSLKLKINDLHSRNTFSGDKRGRDLIAQKDGAPAEKQAFMGKPGPLNALQRFFSRYQPSGTIAVDFEAFGSLKKLSESKLVGKVHCKDISICDRKFPYTVEHLVGRIDLTEKSVVLNNLRGSHGDAEVVFNGWFEGFGPNRKYKIQITSDSMALDDDLYEALSARRRKPWAAFSPTGLAAIDYKLVRRAQNDKEKTLVVELLGVEAAYYRFPYPLKNLSGKLLFTNDSITVSNVISQVNDRKITLNGKVTDYSTANPVYDIAIKAKDILLDSTLASSLSDNQKDFYNQLNMTGLADADIKVFTPQKDSGPTSFIADVSLKKASLKADDFPLLISDILAKTVITPDLIRIEDFTGRHNQALILLTGRIWPGNEARQPRYCLLMHAENKELNDELISLMPVPLKKTVSKLQPEGKLNLTANLNKTDSNDCPEYKITVDCPGNTINFEPFPYPIKDITGRLMITKNAITLENITAAATSDTLITSNTSTVKINGQITLADNVFNSDQLELATGKVVLAADRFRIKGKTLTTLKADTYYDPNRQSWMTKSLIADCYGGKLAGKFELKQSAEAALKYLLQVGFENVDLEQFLLDTNLREAPRNNRTSGRMSGLLSVAGQIGESLPCIGRCRLKITDMQVGRLSPLAKLLYVLKLAEPKDFAFEQMLVDSYIRHKKLFLKKFDLSGEAVAFNGSGWIDLKSRDVDLVLFARGQRLTTDEPSIIQSLTEGLGQAVVRMEVTGNVYDPQVTTTTLPVIKEAVEILGTPHR